MMVMPLQMLLGMSRMQTHEELMARRALVEFVETMGKAMFVSHQWVAAHHPDPASEQLRILQDALVNLQSGQCKVSLPPVIELSVGRLKCPSTADFKNQQLFIWFDYFSVPQDASGKAGEYRSLAITCIPSYVSRSYFFVTLCPPMCHHGRSLTYATWAARGWCRLEHMAAQLTKSVGCHIIITTPQHVTLGWDVNGLCKAPTSGQFSVEEDRSRIHQVVLQMLWGKLQGLLANNKLHQYRFLFNLARFCGCTDIPSLVPSFETQIDAAADPDGFLVARFLHDNVFRNVSDRDAAGWSPLCYAVLTDSVPLVNALLNKRASVNDRTTKSKKEANLPKNLPVLSIATAFHSNDVLQLLLAQDVDVNARCGVLCTALTWAGEADNAAAVPRLLDAKVNPRLKAFPDASPFRAACGCGSVEAMKEKR